MSSVRVNAVNLQCTSYPHACPQQQGRDCCCTSFDTSIDRSPTTKSAAAHRFYSCVCCALNHGEACFCSQCVDLKINPKLRCTTPGTCFCAVRYQVPVPSNTWYLLYKHDIGSRARTSKKQESCSRRNFFFENMCILHQLLSSESRSYYAPVNLSVGGLLS